MKEDEKLNEKVQELFFDKILSRNGNSVCADCNAKGPRWVSLSFGVFICMRCAGPHRGLGPIYTKVRSVKLDVWTRDMAEIMEKIGNKIANEYWEYKMPIGYKKPDVGSSQTELDRFIQEKYMKRSFAPPKFIDPVSEYLDAKKNGNQPKLTNYEPQQTPIQETPKKTVLEAKHLPKPPMDLSKNLWDPNDEDLMPNVDVDDDKQEWTEFQEPQNPPMTPKVKQSSNNMNTMNIMEMYKTSPLDLPKNENNTKNGEFAVNHSFLNSIGSHMMNNNNNMNMKNWSAMNQQQHFNGFNNYNSNHVAFGGMNMMGGGSQLNNNFVGQNPVSPTYNGKIMNNGCDNKVKNSGDIMNLYGNIKNETALSGNEMQMNKKVAGQQNIMGLYSGKNFNVW